MRLVADSGLWSVGPQRSPLPAPLVTVLEVSGAVLTWTIDDPPDASAPQITFTDPRRADWLWRVVGESGHLAMTSAMASAPTSTTAADQPEADLSGVEIDPEPVELLRRLAMGHWLRRWWPASLRDGIAGIDHALLDVEVALLTGAAQAFFTDDTLDSDVTELLSPHGVALLAHSRANDIRIRDLVRAGAELADEVGVDGPGWPELPGALDGSSVSTMLPSGVQHDYALAAGTDIGRRHGSAVARGVASVNWSAVPPRIFDAGEGTVEWSVAADPAGGVAAAVRVAVIGPDPAAGVRVLLRSGGVRGAGALDADGRATLPLVDAQHVPVTASVAWDHDWAATSILVGAEATESAPTRERVRRWVRARLNQPPADAFLAEILAAESAY